ncbi:hypothetical protein [Bacillus wiedmannii]|uniref:hypothetical protein n=1 Tax=Bacillus wiedmannii TaxID=1890302 RepID=UPI00142ED2F8|nr:hypothetical protein [Bacillus wiedmannii]
MSVRCPAPKCENKMVWQSDFDFEDMGREGKGIVSIYICSECESELNLVQKEKEGNKDE